MKKWLEFIFAGMVGISTVEVMIADEKVLQRIPEDDVNPIVFDTQQYPRSVAGAVSSTASIDFSGMWNL